MSGSRDVEVEAAGVRLRAHVAGSAAAGAPVLVLHGFTGAVESMAEVIESLAATRPVVGLDLVGHGQSETPADTARFTMPACVAQVAAALDALEVPRAHVLGYSMGGRIALSLAVAHPRRIASLLLVGASPGLATESERAARARSDEALARWIEREGLECFVDWWMALPRFACQSVRGAAFLARARAQRLRSDPRGLAASLRGMGTGAMPPLHHRLHEIPAPVCLVAGARDEKFVALAASMADRLPHAECALVPDVGHAAHVEDPETFRRLARSFFDQVEGGARVRRASPGPSFTPEESPA